MVMAVFNLWVKVPSDAVSREKHVEGLVKALAGIKFSRDPAQGAHLDNKSLTAWWNISTVHYLKVLTESPANKAVFEKSLKDVSKQFLLPMPSDVQKLMSNNTPTEAMKSGMFGRTSQRNSHAVKEEGPVLPHRHFTAPAA